MKNSDNLDEVINITELLSELLDVLVTNNEQLDGLIYEKDCVEKSKEPSKAVEGFNPKSLLINFITIVSCFLVAAGTKATFRYGLFGPDYNTEILTYSTETGNTKKTKEIKKKIMGIDNRQKYEVVTIETENPWKKINDEYTNDEYFEKNTDIAKIYGVDYDDLSEYLELNLDNHEVDVEYSKEVERKRDLNYKELNQETTCTVIKETQNPKDYTVGVYTKLPERVITNIFIISNILLTYILSQKALRDIFEKDFTSLKEQIVDLINMIRLLKFEKIHDKKRIKKIKYLAGKIKAIVESNSKIEEELNDISKNSDYKSLLCENKSSIEEITKHIKEMKKTSHLALKKRGK